MSCDIASSVLEGGGCRDLGVIRPPCGEIAVDVAQDLGARRVDANEGYNIDSPSGRRDICNEIPPRTIPERDDHIMEQCKRQAEFNLAMNEMRNLRQRVSVPETPPMSRRDKLRAGASPHHQKSTSSDRVRVAKSSMPQRDSSSLYVETELSKDQLRKVLSAVCEICDEDVTLLTEIRMDPQAYWVGLSSSKTTEKALAGLRNAPGVKMVQELNASQKHKRRPRYSSYNKTSPA
jgi:hypothetical protein